MHNYPLSTTARAERHFDIGEFLRYAQHPGMISMAGGLPAQEHFDVAGIATATDMVLRRGGAALQYGVPDGQPALREQLALRLRQKGMSLDGRGVLITTGSQQGLDLLARTLIDPGDAIVVERPTYVAALHAFSLAAPTFLSVGQDEEGAIVGELDQHRLHRPKLIYVVTNFANPSGRTMSLARRLELLAWAARNRVLVIEDDPYGELRTEGVALPSLMELSAQVPGSVPYVGSIGTLSKTVAPGFRVGWMILPAAIADAAVGIKQASDLNTSTFVQEICAAYLASGALESHLAKVRSEYRRRRQALCEALTAGFGDQLDIQEPEGGMFLWTRFRDGTDTRALLKAAVPLGVCFVPGVVFYTDRPDAQCMRLNFSATAAAAMSEGVRRLVAAHRTLVRPAEPAQAGVA